MICQEQIQFPQTLNAGDIAWWTNGLTYLCATYSKGGKIRPEHVEQVTIIQAKGDALIINVPSWPTPIHTCRRWISTDPRVPCEAVLNAYGVNV